MDLVSVARQTWAMRTEESRPPFIKEGSLRTTPPQRPLTNHDWKQRAKGGQVGCSRLSSIGNGQAEMHMAQRMYRVFTGCT